MIYKGRTVRVILRTQTLPRYLMAYIKKGEPAKQSSGSYLVNKNMHCFDHNYDLFISPIYPQLKQNQPNTFSINSEAIVLYFKFVPKPQSSQNDQPSQEEDLSFSFKYPFLNSLLTVQLNSGRQALVQREKTEKKVKIFSSFEVVDHPSTKTVSFKLRKSNSATSLASTVPRVDFICPYWQYHWLQIVLKKSLYDLSGLHLMQQIKRLEQMGELQAHMLNRQRIMDKQIQSYYNS